MSLKSEIEEWRQPDRLIVAKQEQQGTEGHDQTGDGLKHFCLYHALLVRRGESTPEDFEEFERVIRSCFVRPGLPNRSPTKTGEQITKDALISIGYTSKLLKSRLGWEVLNHGNSSRFLWLKWFYANMFPKVFEEKVSIPFGLLTQRSFWEAWMGKNPEVICHFQYAALPPDKEPHFLRRAWFCIYLLVTSVKKGTVYSLSYMMCETAFGQHPLVDFFIELWRSRVEKAGGMPEIMKGEYDNDHPIVRHWI